VTFALWCWLFSGTQLHMIDHPYAAVSVPGEHFTAHRWACTIDGLEFYCYSEAEAYQRAIYCPALNRERGE